VEISIRGPGAGGSVGKELVGYVRLGQSHGMEAAAPRASFSLCPDPDRNEGLFRSQIVVSYLLCFYEATSSAGRRSAIVHGSVLVAQRCGYRSSVGAQRSHAKFV